MDTAHTKSPQKKNFSNSFRPITFLAKHKSKQNIDNIFPYRNRLISGGLEPVLSYTEKLCLASYYIQFSTKMKMYNHKIKISFYLITVNFISVESCL